MSYYEVIMKMTEKQKTDHEEFINEFDAFRKQYAELEKDILHIKLADRITG
jgi:hypothetical protein